MWRLYLHFCDFGKIHYDDLALLFDVRSRKQLLASKQGRVLRYVQIHLPITTFVLKKLCPSSVSHFLLIVQFKMNMTPEKKVFVFDD